MANTDIVFKVEAIVGGSSTKSLADLKNDFSELNKLLSQTKQGTVEYQKVLEALGKTKDDIGDLRDTISALNPEGKVAAFTNVAGKLASGFQAAQGAAALFGAESEELEKTLLKVQAATAFAEGIRGITGMKDAFMVLGAVIRANPIFTLITVITAVTTAIIALSGETDKLAEATKKETEENEKNIKSLDRQIELLEAQGVAEEKIVALKKQKLLLQIAEEEKNKKVKEAQVEEIKNNKTLFENFLALTGLQGRANFEQQKRVADAGKEVDAVTEKILDLQTKIEVEDAKLKKKQIEDAKQAADDQYNIKKEQIDAEIEARKKQREFEEGGTEDLARIQEEERKKKEAKEIEDKQNFEQTKEEIDLVNSAKRADLENQEIEESKKKQIAAAKAISDAKLQIASTSLNSIATLSQAFFQAELAGAKGNSEETIKIRKKQFEVEKAFSIARAVIDGIRSVQTAIANVPPPYSYILAAFNTALTAANVAKIANTKFDSGTSSGGGSIGSPGGGGAAPQINTSVPTIARQDQTNLSPTGYNLSKDNRVYVTEQDINKVTKRVNKVRVQNTW